MTTAQALADRVGEVLDPQVVRGEQQQVVVFLARGPQVIRVDLPEELAVDPTDLVRALAQRWRADAVVVACPVSPPPEAQADAAWNYAIERDGEKLDRLVALRLDPQGAVTHVRLMLRRHTNPHLVWLGVPPASPVEVSELVRDPIAEA